GYRGDARGQSDALSLVTLHRRLEPEATPASKLKLPHLNASNSRAMRAVDHINPPRIGCVAVPKRGPLIAALRDFYPVYLACGSGADITRSPSNVRFTPQSGRSADMLACPLCARTGREQVQQTARLFSLSRE